MEKTRHRAKITNYKFDTNFLAVLDYSALISRGSFYCCIRLRTFLKTGKVVRLLTDCVLP